MTRPLPLDDATRRRLERQGRRDTAPELALRRELHRRGLRYRVDVRPPVDGVRSRVDIFFPRARVAVFVDGCFWHGCPEHGATPVNNREWWREKLQANRERDVRNSTRLETAGYLVLRVWEHEDPIVAADRVQEAVLARSG